MSPIVLLFGLLAACIHANPTDVVGRESCNPCNPQGATGTSPPTFGPDLESLYTDLLNSVKDIHFQKRNADSIGARDDGFCCRESLDCVNVQRLNIPMCYDKFTTNYAFSDGSYGSLTTGDYTQGGSQANLISGQYTKEGGESGNIYAEDPSAKPNTATMSIPPQWTASGEGSAIPASEIGSIVVVTTAFGGTTVSGAPTTLSALTTLGTTISAQTISTPTTIAPVTRVMTSTVASSAQNTAEASSSSTGGAAHVTMDLTGSFRMSLLTALIYALM
ncbi:hypothetical protein K458DRAFT_295541 [Lentithecium fluviatile CBS 122367]|uniref:Uncharacterized protein n=1 Tax=Lentithecium fluviatile CBS 122367 TaxID=1168545 RepID=A0A6G1JBZ2_9PLEO|nr:hypothetical protein K458DRAFT_295541 [Lentithecium fluviatile CBS 122367]